MNVFLSDSADCAKQMVQPIKTNFAPPKSIIADCYKGSRQFYFYIICFQAYNYEKFRMFAVFEKYTQAINEAPMKYIATILLFFMTIALVTSGVILWKRRKETGRITISDIRRMQSRHDPYNIRPAHIFTLAYHTDYSQTTHIRDNQQLKVFRVRRVPYSKNLYN